MGWQLLDRQGAQIVKKGSVNPPVGTIMQYAGSTAPTGYLLCDGTAYSRSVYSELFALIGTSYGVGDGSTTFNVPNLKGRVPVGRDAAQAEFDVLAEAGGAKAHALSTVEMPSHTHVVRADGSEAGWGNQIYTDWNSGGGNTHARGGVLLTGGTSAVGNPYYAAATGSGGAHNNLQPYLTVNYIIKAITGTGAGEFRRYVGEVFYLVTISPPDGAVSANGQAISRASYPVLFGMIGTSFGAGDGSTTFNVPNLKGRVIAGYDPAQGEFDTLGEAGGEKAHTLTTTEIPSHNHTQTAHSHAEQYHVNLQMVLQVGGNERSVHGAAGPVYGHLSSEAPAIQYTGGGQAHNNLQPYITLHPYIQAQ
jgi:microcystin-dependent protein